MTARQIKNLIERIYLSQHDQEKREALKIVYQAFLEKSSHRKNGNWMEVSDDTQTWYHCTECHWQQYDKTCYCPRCGARMDGEIDE